VPPLGALAPQQNLLGVLQIFTTQSRTRPPKVPHNPNDTGRPPGAFSTARRAFWTLRSPRVSTRRPHAQRVPTSQITVSPQG
jgi:hypothetical protein